MRGRAGSGKVSENVHFFPDFGERSPASRALGFSSLRQVLLSPPGLRFFRNSFPTHNDQTLIFPLWGLCVGYSSHVFPSWYLSFSSLLSPPLPRFSLKIQSLPLPETPNVSAMSPPTTWWKKIKSSRYSLAEVAELPGVGRDRGPHKG